MLQGSGKKLPLEQLLNCFKDAKFFFNSSKSKILNSLWKLPDTAVTVF